MHRMASGFVCWNSAASLLTFRSIRFQMPSWRSLATKPWTSKSCGLDLFGKIIVESASPLLFIVIPECIKKNHHVQWLKIMKGSQRWANGICRGIRWWWVFVPHRPKMDLAIYTGELPPGSIFGLLCRLQYVRPVMYGARRGSNRFGKIFF